MNEQSFTISLFDNVGDSRPKPTQCTWAGFCKALASPKVRADKDGQLFSPARYNVPRRLQSNVVELSMLVLEIDGAWKCDCCGLAGPHIMFVSNRVKGADGKVDRSPRCPQCMKSKCGACYVAPKNYSAEATEPYHDICYQTKPHTHTSITQLEISLESIIEACRNVFLRSEQESMPVASARQLPEQTAVVKNGPQRNSRVSAARDNAAEAGGVPPVVGEGIKNLSSAFALYTTHSHMRVTAIECGKDGLCPKCNAEKSKDDPDPWCGAVYGHEHAERCMRVVVPLASPISRDDFPSLWAWSVNQLNEQGIPADPQSKDQNRIFYTPVKFSDDSPYEYHIEPGSFFDWRSVAGCQDVALKLSESSNAAVKSAASIGVGESAKIAEHHSTDNRPLTTDRGFSCFEDLHAALVAAIKLEAHQNTVGNFDMACKAHNGRGKTSLAYYPKTDKVACNNGCDYWDIVASFGLPAARLPMRATVERERQRQYTREWHDVSVENVNTRSHALSLAELSVIYETLLAHEFELSSDDAKAIQRDWKGADGVTPLDPFGPLVPWWRSSENVPPRPLKICSMPNEMQVGAACARLSEWFDLRGVPGFYFERASEGPARPTAEYQHAVWQSQSFGRWRLNLQYKRGLLVPVKDACGFVYAIQIYQSTKDRNPTTLTSRGLPGGAKAIAVKEERAVA